MRFIKLSLPSPLHIWLSAQQTSSSGSNSSSKDEGITTYTVGTYSTGNESVVYDISIHVLPTVPSPTTTHLICREGADIRYSDSDNTTQPTTSRAALYHTKKRNTANSTRSSLSDNLLTAFETNYSSDNWIWVKSSPGYKGYRTWTRFNLDAQMGAIHTKTLPVILAIQ